MIKLLSIQQECDHGPHQSTKLKGVTRLGHITPVHIDHRSRLSNFHHFTSSHSPYVSTFVFDKMDLPLAARCLASAPVDFVPRLLRLVPRPLGRPAARSAVC
eukprot:6204243-Pleurochrysis_carterae.AAC.1